MDEGARLGPWPHNSSIVLIGDSLDWMARRAVKIMLVNTERTNPAPLGLYNKLGFVELDYGLVVMQCALD